MRHGMDGVFVGSGIFKSEHPATTASAIVLATHHFNAPERVTEASSMMAGKAMDGLEMDKLDVRMQDRGA
jgi:pyridoxal 5'-phosphate synthase pdxS subunit